MSKVSNERVSPVASAGRVDMKLEVVVIPGHRGEAAMAAGDCGGSV
jgi:hypothetical protein